MIFHERQINTIHRNGKQISEVYKGNTLVYKSVSKDPSLAGVPVRFDASDNFQEYIVPEGYTKFSVDCVASRGAEVGDGPIHVVGGRGGRVQCTLTINGIDKLWVYAGRYSYLSETSGDQYAWNIPGYNASDIRTNNNGITDNTSLHSRIVVAGGSGSSGRENSIGAGGGGLIGGASRNAQGGTQTSGGQPGDPSDDNAWGTFGLGGAGVEGSGAGGAGWYGGGAGTEGIGGGGGSSYTHPAYCTNVVHTQGYNSGKGYVIITPIE